ncbi:MAG: hypothetical protein IKT55_05065 [Clostridia bacterium]|nr:hypothetical protein [Clostridia bacterium]
MKYVYKTVAALLALAVIAVIICTPMISITIESLIPGALVAVGAYLDSDKAAEILEQTKGEIPTGFGEDISILNIISPTDNSIAAVIRSFGSEESSSTAMEALEPVFPAAIGFAVVLALIVICSIAAAVTAFACKNNRIPIYISIVGCGLNFMLFKTFEDVAKPFTDGTITLSSLVGSDWMMLVGDITEVSMPTTMWLIAAVFVCVIVWTLLYNATLPANEKLARKRMLGEIDE